MKETLRDTVFGQLLRLIFGPNILPYPEELDPTIWRKYVHVEKSGWMAHHGTAQPHNYLIDELQGQQIDEESKGQKTQEKVEESNAATPQTASRAPSTSANSETQLVTDINGIVVNPEKGKDIYVVDWSGPDDPQVCCSFPRRPNLWADNGSEPDELVESETVLRHRRNLSPHILSLHRLCNLYSRYSRCSDDLPCRPSRSNAGTYSVCGRLWTR
jgi:hypothetical protein